MCDGFGFTFGYEFGGAASAEAEQRVLEDGTTGRVTEDDTSRMEEDE